MNISKLKNKYPLATKYPLHQSWQDVEVFKEKISVGHVNIFLSGFQLLGKENIQVTASAGSLKNDPQRRAYFELLERCSIVESNHAIKNLSKIPLSYFNRSHKATVLKSQLFPQSSNPNFWRYARSNGVAAHTSWRNACKNALNELYERDTIIRSWYGEIVPKKLSIPKNFVPKEWFKIYDFEAYSFPNSTPSEVSILIGFPKLKSSPTIYGFGSGSSEANALLSSRKECFQRLGFLWGEDIPKKSPNFSPSPDFHQEFFLYPPNVKLLKSWLSGGHTKYMSNIKKPSPAKYKTLFFDLTPPHLRGKLYVVKAFDPDAIPLVFGKKKLMKESNLPKNLIIHPIA